MRQQSIYFPGLNTIRLYAAISVVLGHAIQFQLVGTQTSWFVNFLVMSGYDAVTLFFVLSGFLITYLLLAERSETSTISVSGFYRRRFLRIQPLYFVVIVLSILFFSTQLPHDLASWTLILIWSPHIVEALRGLGILSHYWSIGVEEWYYFGMPPLFRRLGVIRMVVLIIVARLLMGILFFPEAIFVGDRYGMDLARLFTMLRFESMAMGALMAWILFYKHPILKLLYRIEWFAILVVALVILLPIEGGLIFDFLLSTIFGIFILCSASKPKPLLRLEYRLFRKLGEITYGIYMYHMLVIGGLLLVLQNFPAGFARDVCALILVVCVTIGCSWLSWNYIEKPIKALGLRYPARAKRVLQETES